MATATFKICSKCKVEKIETDFQPYRNTNRNGSITEGFRNVCRDCRAQTQNEYRKNWRKDPAFIKRVKWYDLARGYKRHYGISFEVYCKMFEDQNGQCAICSTEFENSGIGQKRNKLYVDHNHDTGEVRGLLCRKCNTGIGMLNEDLEILNKSIEYLTRGGK